MQANIPKKRGPGVGNGVRPQFFFSVAVQGRRMLPLFVITAFFKQLNNSCLTPLFAPKQGGSTNFFLCYAIAIAMDASG